jgi:hypothetical protein
VTRLQLKLSQPLIAAYSDFCEKAFPEKPFSRSTLNEMHHNLYEFENKTLFVSSFEEYLRLITFVYSKNTCATPIRFDNAGIDALQALTEGYRIEPSKLYSLLLCSLIFTSGKFPIAVKNFFSYFESNNSDYSCQLVITKKIDDLCRNVCRKQVGLPMAALARAAHFYYERIAPDDLLITESPAVTVTNTSIGWKKIFVRGSLEFKNYLFGLKKSTGKTINCIASNVMYQFLTSIKEAAI